VDTTTTIQAMWTLSQQYKLWGHYHNNTNYDKFCLLPLDSVWY